MHFILQKTQHKDLSCMPLQRPLHFKLYTHPSLGNQSKYTKCHLVQLMDF